MNGMLDLGYQPRFLCCSLTLLCRWALLAGWSWLEQKTLKGVWIVVSFLYIPGKDSLIFPLVKTRTSIGRENKNFSCQGCLVTSTFPCRPAEFCLHIFIVHMFIAIIDLLSRKYGEHMEFLSVVCCLFGFLFFYSQRSHSIVLFIPNLSGT